MPWSTRQLADLAGTSVKAVRHYHAIGLLDEPDRAPNGYKQYQVPHLVRLLQIRRLIDLGLPLSRIATLDRADQHPDEAIRALDAELAATIDRLQRVRAELAVVLRHRAAIDLPEGFGSAPDDLSRADRSMLLIYSRVLDDQAMDDLRELVAEREPVDADFDALPEDAGDDTIRALAERLAPALTRVRERYDTVRNVTAHIRDGLDDTGPTVIEALAELYNPAQLRALALAHALTEEQNR